MFYQMIKLQDSYNKEGTVKNKTHKHERENKELIYSTTEETKKVFLIRQKDKNVVIKVENKNKRRINIFFNTFLEMNNQIDKKKIEKLNPYTT